MPLSPSGTSNGNPIRAGTSSKDHSEKSYIDGIGGSLIFAGVLLGFDAVLSGSFALSLLAGPIWLLIAAVRLVSGWQKNRSLVIKRLLIPIVTIGLVFANAGIQSSVAHANAALIIQACQQYRTNKGVYPKQLSDLVPEYLHSVPRAKHALMHTHFLYLTFDQPGGDGHHELTWVEIPPFSRPYYDFEKSHWGYLD